MDKSKMIFVVLAAAVSLAACTKNYYYCPPAEQAGAITLSSEVRFGVEPRLQDNQVFAGQALSLFVTRAGSIDNADLIYNNNRITANGTGGFTYRIPMYYPSDGRPVDFRAIHPYGATTALNTPLAFAVQTDQTVQGNFLASDLLCGDRLNVAPQADAVALTFVHKLAKLDFIITTRSSVFDLNRLTGVWVLNSLPETTLDIPTGNVTAAAGTPVSIKAYGIGSVAGEIGNQALTGYSAIVVPQTAPTTRPLFELMIDGRAVYYTPAADISFATGTKYTVTLDVAPEGITVTSQIQNWTDGGTIGGPAGPQ